MKNINSMQNKKDVLDVLLDEYIKRTKNKQSVQVVKSAKSAEKVRYVNGRMFRY